MPIISRFKGLISDDGMQARAIRGTALSVIGFGGGQVIRLGSNLILTRILFPEAFGLMALVLVVLAALEMFSDVAIETSIVRSDRGDDPDYLNTAWTLKILRGGILWVVACILAVPVANFYQQPELVWMIPVVSLSTILSGFVSIKMALANRHLYLGRLTLVELLGQIAGTAIMIILALWLQSVWALILGTLVGFSFRVLFSHTLLPGERDKLGWDPSAFKEIFHFGKYILVGTVSGFFIQNGDRLILGKFVSLDDLAVYTIALMLGTVPLQLNFHLINRVLLPLYKKLPPSENAENRRKIRHILLLIRIGMSTIALVFAISGQWLIEFLYDDRYHAAGVLLVIFSLSVIPRSITGGYDAILLAAGNSKDFTILLVGTAILTTVLLLLGVSYFGMVGAVLTPVVSSVLSYPAMVYFIRPYGGWFPGMDAILYASVIPLTFLVLWINPDATQLISQVMFSR